MEKPAYLNRPLLLFLILLTILVNFSGIFNPLIRNDDPTLYADIAKNIVLSGDWINLEFNQVDWLDKPHFPFWLTALSFKIFGINSFAYIFPGFIFHLIGAYFTYLLAAKLYKSKDIGLVSALIYLSALHLLMSSIDVRAEAYLLGEIMGACYFWYLYDEHNKISLKYLALGSSFTAIALMTKGLFVLVTIGSGLVFVWAYTGNIINLLKPKWILALVISLLLTFPEVYSLYVQFDSHPEKLVFAHHNVSGIRWFFWDSQFGRFFATGPITVNHVQSFHYLFFIHTFLWAFLPWSILFLLALWVNIKFLLNKENNGLKTINSLYLIGSFLPTFILFSCTKFQLDHYTNIIMPFAAIICANLIVNSENKTIKDSHPIYKIQIYLSYVLAILVLILSVFIFDINILLIILFTSVFVLTVFVKLRRCSNFTKLIVYPTLAINLVFVFLMQINAIAAKYDLGYQSAKYINQLQSMPVVDYNVDSLSLKFHSKFPYQREKTLNELQIKPKPFYLVIKTDDLKLLNLQNSKTLTHVEAATIDKVMAGLLSRDKLKSNLTDYSIVLVK